MGIFMNRMNLAAVVIMVLVAYALWNTPLLYPVKLFVVVLHELSHGLAAILAGGRIISIQIDPRIGGLCTFAIPQSPVLSIFVAASGYLGSIFWGALILVIAAKTRYDRYIALVIGVSLLLLTVFYVREPFGLFFCLLFSAFMCVSFLFLPDSVNDVLFKFLGMASCLYAIVDIKEDLIDRSGIGSDADRIAQLLGAPPWVSIAIGLLWACFAVAVVAVSIRFAGSGRPGRVDTGEDEEGTKS